MHGAIDDIQHDDENDDDVPPLFPFDYRPKSLKKMTEMTPFQRFSRGFNQWVRHHHGRFLFRHELKEELTLFDYNNFVRYYLDNSGVSTDPKYEFYEEWQSERFKNLAKLYAKSHDINDVSLSQDFYDLSHHQDFENVLGAYFFTHSLSRFVDELRDNHYNVKLPDEKEKENKKGVKMAGWHDDWWKD